MGDRPNILGVALAHPISETPGFDVGDSYSHSRRSTESTCLRKFALRYGLKINEAEDPAPLRMGKAFADCLDKQDVRAHQAVYEGYLSAAPRDQWNMWVKEAATIRIMAKHYMLRWGKDKHREVYAERVIPGSSKVDRGYFDFLNPNGKGGWDGPGEDKFRARWSYEQARALLTDPQLTAYLNLALRLGRPLWEPDYRITIRPYIRKNDAPKEWADSLEKAVTRNPDKYFIRVPQEFVTRTPEQLDRFEEMLQRRAAAITRTEAEGLWDPNYDACWTGRLCEYHRICSTGVVPADGTYRVGSSDERGAPSTRLVDL